MSDKILRAIARNAGIQISAASTTGIVERAREIHNTTPLATAALGRTLTITSIMGSQLKVEDGSVTVQIKGNGPLGTIVCVGESDGCVRGYLQNPAADLPLRPDGKLNVGGGVGRGYLMVIKDIGLKDPVTGTVALVDGEIAEDLTRYFAESEQIPSACALGVLVDTDCTVKCAGGWLVQLMPGVKDADIDRLEANLAKLEPMTAMLDKGMSLEEIISAVLDCLIHKNIPNMIASITSAVHTNIENMGNRSRGDYAYTIIDLADQPTEENLAALRAIEGMISVRAI